MGKEGTRIVLKKQALSIVLTTGLIFQGFVAQANDGKVNLSYKNLHQKLVVIQPKVETNNQDNMPEGDLPLINIEKIELEELKMELTQEVIVLQGKLAQLQEQIKEVEKVLERYQVPQILPLSAEDIEGLMLARLEDCSISKIENTKLYKITNNRSESIQFLFSKIESESTTLSEEAAKLAPFANLISAKDKEDEVEVIQPTYKTVGLEKNTEMSAKIHYKVTEEGVKFLFVTFLGQRIEDKLFGRSSLDPHRVVCKTSI